MTNDLKKQIEEKGFESISWKETELLFDPERFIMLFPGFRERERELLDKWPLEKIEEVEQILLSRHKAKENKDKLKRV